MLANQEPAQESRYDPPHQEDVMSSTQELMVPAHNVPSYDAPGGGFSANPKVMPWSRDYTVFFAG